MGLVLEQTQFLDNILFFGFFQVYFKILHYILLTQKFFKMSVRTLLSGYSSFKMFEKISYGLIIKNSIKTGYFCDFFCIGAKIFIIAHHGFHHSVGQCLKYLGYEAYIYAHSPGRGPQLDPKKTRKPYFSRLYQKVDFVRLFSRLDNGVLQNTNLS